MSISLKKVLPKAIFFLLFFCWNVFLNNRILFHTDLPSICSLEIFKFYDRQINWTSPRIFFVFLMQLYNSLKFLRTIDHILRQGTWWYNCISPICIHTKTIDRLRSIIEKSSHDYIKHNGFLITLNNLFGVSE